MGGVDNNKTSIPHCKQYIARSVLALDQGTDENARIHHGAHGLSPGCLDVGNDLVVTEASAHFGKTIPDPVKMRQDFAFLHLLKAQAIFVGDQCCLRARAACQDDRYTLVHHLVEVGAEIPPQFGHTDDLLHFGLLSTANFQIASL